MAERGWVRHAVRIGVFEFRRSVTDLWSSKLRLLSLVAGVAFPSLFVFAGAYLVTVGTFDVSGLIDEGLLPTVRAAFAGAWLMVAFFVAQRTASARPRPPAERLMLTTVSRRTVAVGLFVAESLRLFAYFALPTVGLAWVTFQLFEAPLALVTVPAGFALVGAGGVALGSVVGYAIVALIARVPVVARHRTALSGLASVGFFALYFGVQMAGLGGLGVELLSSVPVGWVADAVLVTSGIASTTTAVVGVVSTAGALVLIGWVGEWVVDLVWYRTPVSTVDETGDESDDPTPEGRDWLGNAVAEAIPVVRFPAVADPPTNRVAAMAVARTVRNPRRLSIFLFPLFGFVWGFAGGDMDLGTALLVLPVVLAGILPWIAGTMFSLNPFGDEGSVLPVTLTAATGRQYVQGIALPGLLVGLPIAVLSVGATGLASSYSPVEVGALVGTAAFSTLVAVAVGPAIGVYWPRYSGFSIGQADEVLPPSMLAMVLSVAVVAVPALALASLFVAPAVTRSGIAVVFGYLPGGILALFGRIVPQIGTLAAWFFDLGNAVGAIEPPTLRAVGAPLLVVGGVAAAAVSYWAAVRRFERYVPP